MQIQEKHILLEPTDPRWMDFIQTCPDANIFHHPAWIALMQACYGYSSSIVALTDAEGDLCAGLPFMKVNSWLTGKPGCQCLSPITAIRYIIMKQPVMHFPSAGDCFSEKQTRQNGDTLGTS